MTQQYLLKDNLVEEIEISDHSENSPNPKIDQDDHK